MDHNNNSGGLPAPASLASSKQKVIFPGQEHTGRWTKEEHEAFLSALQQYGKEWKKVAAKVKTRTVVQTRTHAQKYFQKLNKVLERDGLDGDVRVQQGPGSLTLGSSSATIINAQSLASMMEKGKKKASKHQFSSKKSAKPQQGTNVNTSQVKLPSQPVAVAPSRQSTQSVQPTPRTTSTAEALLNMSAFTGPIDEPCSDDAAVACSGRTYQDINIICTQQHPQQQELTHGFGFPITSTLPNPLSSSISIKAPEEDPTKYPEPSPAACGKRKVAEIAAAQMLVGVSEGIDIEGFSPNPLAKRPSFGNETSVVGGAAQDVLGDYGFQTEDDAFLAEVFGVDGRAATPPLTEQGGGPAANVGTSNRSSLGSLQIVNPDALEDIGEIIQKRRCVNGQASPSTPWDGQLEALVNHVHQQEAQETKTTEVVRSDDGLSKVKCPPRPNPTPLPLRSPTTELEHAIYNASISQVSELLSTQTLTIKCNDIGYHSLHSAAALGMMRCNCNEAVEICRRLIEAGADVLVKDKDGNTALHWAARSGHCGVMRLLLNRNCPIDAQNDAFETALHWAMRAGSQGMVAVQLLVESGARTNLYSRNHKRPLDVAAEGFFSLKEDGNEFIYGKVPVDQRERRTTRWNMLNFSSQCRTLVLHHHECLDHMTKSDHDWEVPDRIDSIMSMLASRTSESCAPEDEYNFHSCEITVSNEFERATLELLSRIHSADYLAFVNELSKDLDRKRKQQLLENALRNNPAPSTFGHTVQIVPFTPMIQKKFIKEAMAKVDGHSDTSFSAGSLKAARRAAGAVQHAVDCVLVGRNRNAFCVVRPPGHHAGINGLLSDAESCGFCLFNNVAAGAMHALSDEKHRPRCERCAIVDIDAHHGNGTEEIVRKCHDSGRLLFFSVHLYDYDKPNKDTDLEYKFYPGTGADDDVPHNVINVPIAPLWRAKEVIKSVASGLCSEPPMEPRQTRLKSKTDTRMPTSTDLMASNESAQNLSDGSEINYHSVMLRSQLPMSSPHPPHFLMGVGRLAYRRAIQHRLLPALRAFNPDLIIMSTGFDAARGDVGNARHFVNGTQAMGLDLEPEDYAWTSRKICEVADICCNGRVVSVLEGGYGRAPAKDNHKPLEKMFFSECAVHHLKGLVDPYCDTSIKQGGPK